MVLSLDYARLVAVLLHTLWQGLVLAGLLFLVLRRISAAHANARYAATLVALAGLVVASAATWAVLGYEPAGGPVQKSAAGVHVPAAPAPASPPALAESPAPPEPAHPDWTRSAAIGWLAGVVLMLVRTLRSVWGVGRLTHQCQPFDDARMLESLAGLARAIGRVRVMVGEHVRMPCVVGVLWPAVLLPAALVGGMTPEQVRLVLAHELAHVRRYDYLVNMVQMLVEALLFFNPALWWISRQVRIEREACCDALAVGATGEPVAYARTLADWAAQHRAAGAPAFGERSGSGRLLDRLSRVLVGGHRPRLRVPWYSLIAVVLCSVLLLAGLVRGTTTAVEAAARWLTPRERIERLKVVDQTHGKPAHRKYGPDDMITVSGTLRTSDDSPLPKKLRLTARSRRKGYSASYSVHVSGGRFSKRVEFGAVWLYAEASSYAPAIAGPLTAAPGGVIEGVDMVLDPGFVGRLKLTDPSGKPVPGGRIIGGYWLSKRIWIPRVESASDPTGVATFEHCATRPMDLRVRAPGYQYDRRTIRLQAGRAAAWTLQPARPTTGVVVSKVTGKPIAGARFRLKVQRGPQPEGYGLEPREVWAVSGPDGRFVLDALRDDSRYVFRVDAPQHAPLFLHYVVAGRQGLRVRMHGELHVRGKVVGPLDQLKTWGRRPMISYCNPYHLLDEGGTHREIKNLRLTVREGEGHFEIRGLWPGKVYLYVGDQQMVLDLEKPIDGLVVDVTPRPRPTRQVVIRFDAPADALPTGQVVAHFHSEDGRHPGYIYKELPIVDGQARVDVPAPGKLTVQARGTVGYWFDEAKADVAADKQPFVLAVPVVPAGAIYGRVLDADGSPAETALMSLLVVKRPPVKKGFRSSVLNPKIAAPNAEFLAGPLPLGGVYRAITYRGCSYAVGPEMALDAARPARQLTLRLPPGAAVEGQVLTPRGAPAPGVGVELFYHPPGHRFGGPSESTDRNGRFRFEHVNPDVPGRYDLQLPMRRKYRPVRLRVTPGSGSLAIRLERGRVVTGKVVDNATGQPVAVARVWAWAYASGTGSETLEAETPTNERGEFRFSNMDARSYSLNVRDARRVGECEVTAGQTEPVTIRVTIPEWSRLSRRRAARGG